VPACGHAFQRVHLSGRLQHVVGFGFATFGRLDFRGGVQAPVELDGEQHAAPVLHDDEVEVRHERTLPLPSVEV